jgi:pimeloyl-ACP methyl ester carboxylesterase
LYVIFFFIQKNVVNFNIAMHFVADHTQISMQSQCAQGMYMIHAYRVASFVWLSLGMLKISACEQEKTKRNRHNERNQTVNKQAHSSPYREVEVGYHNTTAGVSLVGSITIPQSKGLHPVVVLIAGMGPNDRNSRTYFGRKPFQVLADHLTHQGIAVLRYDKRGVGKSTGTFDTTVTSKDFADDVMAGIEYLKTRPDIDVQQIGLIGHSEGGMIATMVAAQSKDVAFVVMMGGAVATTPEASIEHTALQLCADGATEEIINRDRAIRQKVLDIVTQEKNSELAEQQALEVIEQYWLKLPEALQQESTKLLFAFTITNAAARIKLFNSPWYRFFLSYSPADSLTKVTVPVLALNGEYDWISSPRITFPVIAKALSEASNSDYTLVTLPKHNHSLQTCLTGSITEYATIQESISPVALKMMSDWIIMRTSRV